MGRRGGGHDGPDGLVVVDKPTGWTSHDVVAKSRGLLGTRKVGHAGTLDPDATGVLLLGVGKATKLLRFLSPLGKGYVGEVRLGIDTASLDASGAVTATHDMAAVTLDEVRAAAAAFVGDTEQIPPMVSAVKIDGKRLHELAREGKEVERAPRPVTIHALSIEPVGSVTSPDGCVVDVAALERIGGQPSPEWTAAAADGSGISFAIAVSCSAGTYIRTLAQDLGAAFGGGAHLTSLRRTSVGPYTLADAVPLEKVAPEVALPVADAVRHLARVCVDDEVAAAVAVGKVMEREALGIGPDDAGEWAIFGDDGSLLGVYQPFRATTVKPSLVIPT